MAKTYKDVVAWKKAHQLVIEIYKITKKFPSEEKFGLVSQMRRSAVSVPSNIVEGFHRKGHKDAIHFFNISEASLKELEYQTLLAYDLNYLNEDKFYKLEKLQDDIGRLLTKWKQSYYQKKD